MTIIDWLPVLTGIGGGGLGAGIRPLLDFYRTKRQQSDEVAINLVEKLQARVEGLERDAEQERQSCDAKLSVLRHELRNVQNNFDALLLAIEVAPEKASEVVAKINARRHMSK